MVEVVLEAELFKTMLKGLNALVSEARVVFSEEGIKSYVIDPSNVAMLLIDVPVDSTEAYTIDTETEVGIDVNRLSDIAKSFKKRDIVSISLKDGYLKLRTNTMEYTILAIDPSTLRKAKTPELELPAKVVLDAQEFKNAITYCSKVSDNVVFSVEDGKFTIFARGDIESVKVEPVTIEINDAKAKAMFSLEWLTHIAKTFPKEATLTIRLGTDVPVELKCEDSIIMTFYIAPRIEPEGE